MLPLVNRINEVVPNRIVQAGNPPKPATLRVSLGTGQGNAPIEFELSVSAATLLQEALSSTLRALGSQ